MQPVYTQYLVPKTESSIPLFCIFFKGDSTDSTLKNGRFIEVNESHTRVSGFTREEVIGQTTAKFKIWTDPEDRKRLVQKVKQNGRFSNEEVKIRTKSGKVNTVLMSAEVNIFLPVI